MLSKNNKQEQNRRLEEKNNRFSIRKFTVGTASVLIGAFFMGVSGTQTVHAADTTTVDVNSLKQAQAPSESLNSSLSLDDDLGLGDLLKGFDNYKNTQTTTPSQSEEPKKETKTQAPDQSSTKKDQQSDINDDLNKLINDANKVKNSNTSTDSQDHKTEVKENTRTIIRKTNVYLPGVNANDDYVDQGYYYKDLNMDDMPETQIFIDGKKSSTMWQSKSYQAMSLSDALQGDDWTLADNGTDGHALPQEDGWTAQIARVTVDALGGTEGIFEQTQRDEAKKLATQLNAEIAKNPYEIPAYTISSPLAVTFHIGYVKDTPVKVETRERLDVTLPTSTDPDEDYYYGAINTDANDMTGTKSADGKYTWTPVEHAALDLNAALSKPDFVYAENGSWHNTLPSIPGYRAYISDVTANSASPEDEDNEAEVDALQDALYEKIDANPYEIPAYTTTTPINVYFYVEYEKVSDNGDAVTTPALPEYKGNVAGIPETRPADKPFEGGVAGNPLTQETLPEAQVGVPGDALTEDALPVAKVGIAGEPLTQKALPEAQVGIAGKPLTQETLPEARVGIASEPLTQAVLPEAQVGVAGEPLVEAALPAYTGKISTNGDAITVPALPEYNLDNQTSDRDSEPVVTPEATAEAPATVAPHATDAAETEVVDNNVVEDDTTAPVHSNEVSEDLSNHVAQADTTVAVKNEVNVDSNKREAKHEATLPQTGAKTTAAGVLGLLMVGVAAVVGLAIDRKRKN